MRGEARGKGHIDRAAKVHGISGGAISRKGIGGDRLLGHAARDPPIERIDRAARRIGRIEQHFRAVEHIDLLDVERVDGNAVVGGDRRGIERAQPVGQHLHPRAVKSAQHRARRAGGKAAGRNPGEMRKDAAELRGGAPGKILAADHHRSDNRIAVARNQATGHHDRRMPGIVGLCRIDLAALSLRRRTRSGHAGVWGRRGRIGGNKQHGAKRAAGGKRSSGH